MKTALFGLLLLVSMASAQADEAKDWVNFGGLSYHIPSKSYNDANYGFGVEHNLGNRWGIVAGTYYNSLRNQAYYAGATYVIKKKAFLDADFGTMAYFVTGYQNNGVPALIPFATLCWKYGCVISNGVVSSAMLRIPVGSF